MEGRQIRIEARIETDQHIELREILREKSLPWRKFTIGIDGRDGAGKTDLAHYLSWHLNMPAISLDMLMELGDDGPPTYRLDDLSRLIESRHKDDRPVIVEGVLLLDVLSKLGVTCDYLVYVEWGAQKSFGELADWLDGYDRGYDPRKKADHVFSRSEWQPIV